MPSTPSTTECLTNIRPKINIYYRLLYIHPEMSIYNSYEQEVLFIGNGCNEDSMATMIQN